MSLSAWNLFDGNPIYVQYFLWSELCNLFEWSIETNQDWTHVPWNLIAIMILFTTFIIDQET